MKIKKHFSVVKISQKFTFLNRHQIMVLKKSTQLAGFQRLSGLGFHKDVPREKYGSSAFTDLGAVFIQ
jgi:hypothetical protein